MFKLKKKRKPIYSEIDIIDARLDVLIESAVLIAERFDIQLSGVTGTPKDTDIGKVFDKLFVLNAYLAQILTKEMGKDYSTASLKKEKFRRSVDMKPEDIGYLKYTGMGICNGTECCLHCVNYLRIKIHSFCELHQLELFENVGKCRDFKWKNTSFKSFDSLDEYELRKKEVS